MEGPGEEAIPAARGICSRVFNGKKVVLTPGEDGFAKQSFKVSADKKRFYLQVWPKPDPRLPAKTSFFFDETPEQHAQNHRLLRSVNVRIPDLAEWGESGNFFFVMSEFVEGAKMTPFDKTPLEPGQYREMAESILRFHHLTALASGHPGFPPYRDSPHAIYLSYVRECLAEGEPYSPYLRANAGKLLRIQDERAGAFTERAVFHFTYMDLKLDHVLLTEEGPCFLDYGNGQYFDPEYDLAMLHSDAEGLHGRKILEEYRALSPEPWDPGRVAFYAMGHYIDWIGFFEAQIAHGKAPAEFRSYADCAIGWLDKELGKYT